LKDKVRILQRGKNLKNDIPAAWDILLYPTCMTSGFAYEYFQAQERYQKNVSKYILDKYLPQAIENGFQDYEIS
jgi:hypothetical protein